MQLIKPFARWLGRVLLAWTGDPEDVVILALAKQDKKDRRLKWFHDPNGLIRTADGFNGGSYSIELTAEDGHFVMYSNFADDLGDEPTIVGEAVGHFSTWDAAHAAAQEHHGETIDRWFANFTAEANGVASARNAQGGSMRVLLRGHRKGNILSATP
jgi:hypothetical protein